MLCFDLVGLVDCLEWVGLMGCCCVCRCWLGWVWCVFSGLRFWWCGRLLCWCACGLALRFDLVCGLMFYLYRCFCLAFSVCFAWFATGFWWFECVTCLGLRVGWLIVLVLGCVVACWILRSGAGCYLGVCWALACCV